MYLPKSIKMYLKNMRDILTRKETKQGFGTLDSLRVPR